jgi:1-aminocyclopropane-1-carboxylate deaminase
MLVVPPLESLVEHIENPLYAQKRVYLYVLRLDKIDPLISGNKWFKLKYNLQQAQKEGHTKILTFGGAYSNHILATAAAGAELRIPTIGIIRGEKTEPLNDRLQKASQLGMQLHYISREQYREKNNTNFLAYLHQLFGSFYVIPEGGSNALALQGTSEILSFLDAFPTSFDYVCTCVGTGGTIAGLATSLYQKPTRLLGFSVLKNAYFLYDEISELLRSAQVENYQKFELQLDYHFGGYAKTQPELLSFVENFSNLYMPIEPVYTGKMFYGIHDLILKDFFMPQTRILAIHCGGIFPPKGS